MTRDSVDIELNKIKARSQLLKIKDSIRDVIVKQELNNIVNPKSKELEKYKTELLKIKKEDSLRLAQQKESVEKLRQKVKPTRLSFFISHFSKFIQD
ncbi:hypothetical protein HER18_03040 [Chryseobacterium sp. NEB161]|nr:hypothetical protein HER18_03040 [Chryseobacterium sp. NEB161]